MEPLENAYSTGNVEGKESVGGISGETFILQTITIFFALNEFVTGVNLVKIISERQ